MTQNRSSEVRNWAMLCHLSALTLFLGIPFGIPIGLPLIVPMALIGPFIVWLLKREDDLFIDEQGKESLNFQISMTIYSLCLSPLICACGLGLLLITILGVIDIIFVIIASLEAASGHPYRYPLTLRFLN